jgi:hypothetical protein
MFIIGLFQEPSEMAPGHQEQGMLINGVSPGTNQVVPELVFVDIPVLAALLEIGS